MTAYPEFGSSGADAATCISSAITRDVSMETDNPKKADFGQTVEDDLPGPVQVLSFGVRFTISCLCCGFSIHTPRMFLDRDAHAYEAVSAHVAVAHVLSAAVDGSSVRVVQSIRFQSLWVPKSRKSLHCMSPFGDPAENVEPDPTLALMGKDSFVIIMIPLSAQCFNKGRKNQSFYSCIGFILTCHPFYGLISHLNLYGMLR